MCGGDFWWFWQWRGCVCIVPCDVCGGQFNVCVGIGEAVSV